MKRETVTKTYDIDGLDGLWLTAENGSITVDGNRGDELVVRGRKAALTESSLESLALESQQWRPGDFLVRAPTPALSGPDPRLDLDVTVPEGIRLARAETTNGDVKVRHVTGELDAGTKNGRIDVQGVDGKLSAASNTGSIDATGVTGDLYARTSDGSIDVTLTDGGGHLTVRSSYGDITVRAPTSLDATVSVSTGTGTVALDGFSSSGVSRQGSGEVTLGDGSRNIELDTQNGDVLIRGTETA